MRLCDRCQAAWAPGGRFLSVRYLHWGASGFAEQDAKSPPRTLVVPLASAKTFADLAAGGLRQTQVAAVPGARAIDRPENVLPGAGDYLPGPSPGIYVFAKQSVHRNLYRIPLP